MMSVMIFLAVNIWLIIVNLVFVIRNWVYLWRIKTVHKVVTMKKQAASRGFISFMVCNLLAKVNDFICELVCFNCFNRNDLIVYSYCCSSFPLWRLGGL